MEKNEVSNISESSTRAKRFTGRDRNQIDLEIKKRHSDVDGSRHRSRITNCCLSIYRVLRARFPNGVTFFHHSDGFVSFGLRHWFHNDRDCHAANHSKNMDRNKEGKQVIWPFVVCFVTEEVFIFSLRSDDN